MPCYSRITSTPAIHPVSSQPEKRVALYDAIRKELCFRLGRRSASSIMLPSILQVLSLTCICGQIYMSAFWTTLRSVDNIVDLAEKESYRMGRHPSTGQMYLLLAIGRNILRDNEQWSLAPISIDPELQLAEQSAHTRRSVGPLHSWLKSSKDHCI